VITGIETGEDKVMIIGKTGLSDQRILPVSVIFDTGPE